MWSKASTRALVIVVAVLAIIYGVSFIWSPRAKVRTFRDTVIALDTAAVTSFTLSPPTTGHQDLLFKRDGHTWTMTYDGQLYTVDRKKVQEFLGPFVQMRPKRMVGSLDQVRERYGFVDSVRTDVELTLVDGSKQHLNIGQNTFAPGQVGMWSYVNPEGDKDVFAVESTTSMLAKQAPDDWRPHVLVAGNATDIERLTFRYMSDSSYVLARDSSRWTLDGDPADQGKVDTYIASLVRAKARSFADTVDVARRMPTHQLEIIDRTRPGPIEVKVYPTVGGFVVTSSLNPGNVMRFDAARELPRMFHPRSYWVP
ncbi:MAG: DUF4340 domain-containing protein [Flavobacteriales bacterium]|nr:DUF4340 domain-containing protein [Flavobacteriales bacterium]MCB9194575.1 DUF4340 domain-containing protein [Flavobacteriales bacterium]